MILTNKFNLPMPLYRAVDNDKYDRGKSDYTTSQLSGIPARQYALRRKHWGDITEDVSERIYSLSGQSKHVILERAAEFCDEYDYLAEKRFYVTLGGKVIGGQIDLYDQTGAILYDWKECSVWVSKQDLKEEWIRQANINALLLRENGYEVKEAINIALYRDWKKAQADTAKNYPAHQVEQYPLPLWSKEQTETFILERIAELESATNKLPECSDEERWYSGDVFALMKKGGKRAVKLFDTEKEAVEHMEIFDLNQHEVVFRPGKNKRCENYCNVASFCQQWQSIKPQENGNESE